MHIPSRAEIEREIAKQRKKERTQIVYVTIPLTVVHQKGITKRGLLTKIRQHLPIGASGGSDFSVHQILRKSWKFAKEPKL